VEHIFSSWPTFAAAAGAASHLLLLSDYDGTLTPIVGDPKDAVLAPGVRKKLSALAQKPAASAGIISGRAMADLKSLVAIEGIYYAGNHGLEIEGPGLRYVSPPAGEARATIKGLAGQLAAALANTGGVIVEDKGLSLSVHYRLVKEGEVDAVVKTFRQVTAPLLDEGKIKITSGKKVLEVRPPIDWHKGKAVEAITREIKSLLKLEAVLTLYLGDDTTDEDAFKVLHRPEGWSIFVGGENPASGAAYYLNSTQEVEELLSRLIEMK
jgi:trehalose-phosphatase